jgi:uncharacterized membrane protein
MARWRACRSASARGLEWKRGLHGNGKMQEVARNLDVESQQRLEAELSQRIERNISDILELESKELRATSGAHRWLEALSRYIARPAYFICLLVFVGAWIALNLEGRLIGIAPFDRAPFPWLQGLLTATALLTTTVVLVGQGLQSRLSEQRAHIDLQINLLTEQKVTKLIHLLEELRRDMPGVRDRHDPHVSELQKATDAAQLASALKRSSVSDSVAEQSEDPDR